MARLPGRNVGMETLIDEVVLTLDERFLEYVLGTLRDGPTLYDLLRRKIDFSRGQLAALVPPNATESQKYNFEGGGLNISVLRGLSLGTSCRSVIAAKINIYLSLADSNIAIIPDSMARASDSIISKQGWRDVWRLKDPPRAWLNGEEVNWVLLPGDDAVFIEDTIALADVPPFVLVLSSFPQQTSCCLSSRVDISIHDMETLVGRAASVYFGAYDGESYLVWSRELI